MEFVKWSNDNHSDIVPDFFSGDVIEPEVIGKYREVVEEALHDVEDLYGIDADFDVVLAEIDVEKMRERHGGDIPHQAFLRGYSLSRDHHDHAKGNIIFLATSDEYEWWEPGLKTLLVHEESHQEFFRIWEDMDHLIWESIIFEGHAQYREKEVIEEKGYNWQMRQDEFNGPASEIKDVLDKRRHSGIDRYDEGETSTLFNFGSEEWPGAKGYVIALEVYRDILERHEMDVDDPIHKSRDWLKCELRNSLEILYGED